MPLFYFDIHDGERLSTDESGTDLENVQAARNAAIATLAEVAAHVLPTTEHRQIAITVFDHARLELFHVRMVVVEAWNGKTSTL